MKDNAIGMSQLCTRSLFVAIYTGLQHWWHTTVTPQPVMLHTYPVVERPILTRTTSSFPKTSRMNFSAQTQPVNKSENMWKRSKGDTNHRPLTDQPVTRDLTPSAPIKPPNVCRALKMGHLLSFHHRVTLPEWKQTYRFNYPWHFH